MNAVKCCLLSVMIIFLLSLSDARAARLKDVADVEGVRDNQLMGYGLVVGLNGTGDSSNRALFTTQSLVMMLERMGISSRDIKSQIKVQNVASVIVTGTLPPFARQGSRLDVMLSSLGDAKSIEGGTLILTPLKGADGKVYAVGQGPVSIGGGTGDGRTPYPTVGRIAGGAIVEKEIPFEFKHEKTLQLALKNPDFTTANRMVRAINATFASNLAEARDSGTVDLTIPPTYQGRIVEFVARLENLQVETDTPAKIVINERTGTVVMGENVRIATVALSHGKLSIKIGKPDTGSNAATADNRRPNEQASTRQPVETQENRLVEMEEGVTLGDLIASLNNLGVTPRDLIAILQAIQAAGALQAEMEIL